MVECAPEVWFEIGVKYFQWKKCWPLRKKWVLTALMGTEKFAIDPKFLQKVAKSWKARNSSIIFK